MSCNCTVSYIHSRPKYIKKNWKKLCCSTELTTWSCQSYYMAVKHGKQQRETRKRVTPFRIDAWEKSLGLDGQIKIQLKNSTYENKNNRSKRHHTYKEMELDWPCPKNAEHTKICITALTWHPEGNIYKWGPKDNCVCQGIFAIILLFISNIFFIFQGGRDPHDPPSRSAHQ